MKLLLSSIFVATLSGCAIEPVQLPQVPFAYDQSQSVALHYATAMGITEIVDLPEGKAEQLLKERHESMLEAGVNASLSGYVLSFAFATALGLPSSVSHDLAADTVESQFIMGAGTSESRLARDQDILAFYLPYELADSPEVARRYVFNYFINVMQDMGLKLEDVESEYEYGLGKPFSHSVCTELDTKCRYRVRVGEPVLAYAPEQQGGYRAWVWSLPSRNLPDVSIYNLGGWGNLLSFDMDKIAANEIAIQDSFDKPLKNSYPAWAVEYRTATYNEAPFVRVNGTNYPFVIPE